jgi:beta-ribofuranosylaminobenzene 5'-phosphate synthase
MTSARRVTVSTGARLHFGLLTHRPTSGREFGGLGVMVNSPGWTIAVSTIDAAEDSEPDRLTVADSATLACPETESRIAAVVDRIRRQKHLNVPPLDVSVLEAIPSHRGLGSGTQLALATARAIDACLHSGQIPVDQLALLTGRGLRSAVGTWGFESGGLIVDGGKLELEPVGTLAARLQFPPDWRFLLIFPNSASGLSGEDEIAAFENLSGMPQETTDTLCRLTVMQFLPAVQNADFGRASAAICQYGRRVGEYFAPAQGGIYVDSRMLDLSRRLADEGIEGFAQTSWGPTCAVLCQDEIMAARVSDLVQSTPQTRDCECLITSPLNRGATVEFVQAARE